MFKHQNVWQALKEGISSSQEGIRVFTDKDQVVHLPPSALLEEIDEYGAGLVERGIDPGDRVAILAQTTPPVLLSFLGCWRMGSIPVPLPLPLRAVDPGIFIQQTVKKLRASGARLLIVPRDLLSFTQGLEASCPVIAAEEVPWRGGALPEPASGPEDVALLQYTSGSTSEPRGVTLTHKSMIANAFSIIETIKVTPEDRVVSWLPLYHDMGLIGFFFTALAAKTSSVYLPPQLFVSRPLLWLEAMSRYRCTITGGPNFAYALIARLLEKEYIQGLDLSSLRLSLNGAEPIDMEVIERLIKAASRYGMSAEVPYPVYGLAEATLAVTFPLPGRKFKVDWVSQYHLHSTGEALPVDPHCPGSRPLVSLGSPLPGLEVRIKRSDGSWAQERELGEICVRGDSVMRGYWEDPVQTSVALREGWLHTGDQGYLCEGELYVTGRIKDMIIVGGKNIFPEDIEGCAERVPGVRKGNAVAFGITNRRGRERPVLVSETHLQPGEQAQEVVGAVSRAIVEQIGVPLHEVVLVKAGSLPKTSSGKKQRYACRQLYLQGELQVVARSGSRQLKGASAIN